MILTCPSCGLEIDSPSIQTCPKCDSTIRERSNGKVKCVDVAHSGEDLEQALRKLERAIDDAIRGNFRGLKVVHGRGSTTGISRIKPHIISAMKRAARDYDGKVVPDRDNPGAHLIWFD